MPLDDTALVERFHRHYYDLGTDGATWKETYWLGVPTQKLPLDLWMYQQIITELRPDVIIETGTLYGGSGLFLASVCDLLGTGRVITVDINKTPIPIRHPRLTMLTGSSTAPEVHTQLDAMIEPDETCMVILDSDHSRDHVFDELQLFARRVSPGQYMIVEDTNINGHPVLPDFGPGPMEAIDEWLPQHTDFTVDLNRETFGLTFNPRGFLRRKGDASERWGDSETALRGQVTINSGDWLAAVADEIRRLRGAELDRIINERDRLLLALLDAEQVIAGTTHFHQQSSPRAAELERDLSALRSSLSWRITAPLRGLRRMLPRRG